MKASRHHVYYMTLWAFGFGLLQIFLHTLVLLLFGSIDLSARGLIHILSGFPGHVLTGIVLVLLVWFTENRLLAAAAFIPTVGICFFNLFAFHYHAVFGTLPGWSVLYYVRELKNIAVSVSVEAPAAWFAGELLLSSAAVGALLLYLKRRSRLAPPGAPYRFYASAAILIACLIFTLFIHLFPPPPGRPSLSKAQIPLLGFLQSLHNKNAGNSNPATTKEEDVDFVLKCLGLHPPAGGMDPKYPLCSNEPAGKERKGNGASVIFIILESVGREEIEFQYEGLPVMPNLRRIADENLSFENFFAAGTQSCQSLPALFSGLPAQPSTVLLWEKPMKTFEGFPSLLRQKEYRTGFFHGGDLSFEQQRQYLEMAGFDEIHEYDPSLNIPVCGWGYSDKEMFQWLQKWITEHRSQHAGAPFLASLYTLTSHHPYALPDDWKRVFQSEGKLARYYETLRFLDAQLGPFYDWFLKKEAGRGTFLVITGDHSPLMANSEASEKGEKLRFDVPLIIAVPDEKNREKMRPAAGRHGGHHDIPATLMYLLDLPGGRCDQGLSLVSVEEPWPSDRLVYGVTGKELSHIYVWSSKGEGSWSLDMKKRKFFPASGHETGKIKKWTARVTSFLNRLLPLSKHLVSKNAFAPPGEFYSIARPPLPAVEAPIFAGHCANVDGIQPLGKRNRLEAIERAAAAGFEWVEIDVNITKDRIPVLVHDGEVPDHGGKKHALARLTLEQVRGLPRMKGINTLEEVVEKACGRVGLLIEAKPQQNHIDEGDLAREISRIVLEKKGVKDVIVDSFSLSIAASVKKQCSKCQVALDVPWAESLPEGWLKTAVMTHLDWVYIHESMATPEAIAGAHRHGLKVMIFTVNDVETLKKLAPEFPDGVITDYYEVAREFAGYLKNNKAKSAK